MVETEGFYRAAGLGRYQEKRVGEVDPAFDSFYGAGIGESSV